MKQALLAVSIGTSVPRARQDIEAVERVLAAGAPERAFCRAYTSPTIRRILAERGEPVSGLPEALETLAAAGVEDVAVQPTHLLYGFEYDKLKADAAAFAGRFARLALGRPLAADSESLRALAACMARRFGQPEGGALVLLGHGTEHFANMVYPAMQTALRLAGGRRALYGHGGGLARL
ncbi:MAG: sirohydrochlorin cobaltochelatase [Ruthenibacterium lactatiformans]